jgi:hypothetical protein
MSAKRRVYDRALTVRRVSLGAAVALVMGTGAGAALRPQHAEWRQPAAPQQIIVPEAALLALEREGGGWPARASS